MLYLFTVYLVFYQQILNRLFGHYRALTTLLGKKILRSDMVKWAKKWYIIFIL